MTDDAQSQARTNTLIDHNTDVLRSDGHVVQRVGVMRVVGDGNPIDLNRPQGTTEEPARASIQPHDGSVWKVDGDGKVSSSRPIKGVGEAEAELVGGSGESPPATRTFTAEEEAAIAHPVLGSYNKALLTDGALSPELVRQATQQFNVTEDVVREYEQFQKSKLNLGQEAQPAHTPEQRAAIHLAFEFSKDLPGWQSFSNFCRDNLNPSIVKTISDAVENAKNDPGHARGVVGKYWSQYQASGAAAARVTPPPSPPQRPGPSPSGGFASQRDMISAMQDARYNRDPDYTAEVERMVAHSKY